MPRRKRIHIDCMPLHIVQRGHNRSACFFDDQDRFDGTPVDDVVQLLSGSGLVLKFRVSSGETLKVQLACPSPEAGWLLTVDCSLPFIGSFSTGTTGTKAVSQVIGATGTLKMP